MLFIFAPCKITENLLFSIDRFINIRYIVFIAQNFKHGIDVLVSQKQSMFSFIR